MVDLYKSEKENLNIFIKEQKATIQDLTMKTVYIEEQKIKVA